MAYRTAIAGPLSPRFLIVLASVALQIGCGKDRPLKEPAGYAATPQRVIGLPEPAVEVAMAGDGQVHCARLVSGQVYCWGPVLDSVDSKGYWSTPVMVDLSGYAQKLGSHRSVLVMLSSTSLATIFMGQIRSLSVPEGEQVLALSDVEDDDEVVRYQSGRFGSTATTPSSFHVRDAPPGIIQFAGGAG